MWGGEGMLNKILLFNREAGHIEVERGKKNLLGKKLKIVTHFN